MNAPTKSVEERIEEKINPDTTRELAVTDQAGGLDFTNATQAMEFAKLMSIGGVAVPKHLRGQPGACLAVVIQAIEWRLSPYAVANKSYSVNDRLAYESQLIQAVILRRAPIKGRFKLEYKGTGKDRVCRVWAELTDPPGEIVDYESPPIGTIPVQNSPLWKGDPDQQLFYYSARALCRRHFPDVILGVYTVDEIDAQLGHVGPENAKDVTPPRGMGEKLDALAGGPMLPSELNRRAREEAQGEAQDGRQDETAQGTAEAGEAAGEAATAQETANKPEASFAPNAKARAEAATASQAAAEVSPATEADPIKIARQRGRDAQRAGAKRSAIPGEYRVDGREAEAKAWSAGWREAWDQTATEQDRTAAGR